MNPVATHDTFYDIDPDWAARYLRCSYDEQVAITAACNEYDAIMANIENAAMLRNLAEWRQDVLTSVIDERRGEIRVVKEKLHTARRAFDSASNGAVDILKVVTVFVEHLTEEADCCDGKRSRKWRAIDCNTLHRAELWNGILNPMQDNATASGRASNDDDTGTGSRKKKPREKCVWSVAAELKEIRDMLKAMCEALRDDMAYLYFSYGNSDDPDWSNHRWQRFSQLRKCVTVHCAFQLDTLLQGYRYEEKAKELPESEQQAFLDGVREDVRAFDEMTSAVINDIEDRLANGQGFDRGKQRKYFRRLFGDNGHSDWQKARMIARLPREELVEALACGLSYESEAVRASDK